jgi:hypothetical protein
VRFLQLRGGHDVEAVRVARTPILRATTGGYIKRQESHEAQKALQNA